MNYTLIKKYLERKTTETESKKVRKWLTDPNNDTESRKILGEFWMNSDIKLKGSSPDFNLLLNTVHHTIKNSKENLSISNLYSGRRITRFYKIFSKIAAILILPLLLGSLYLYINLKQDIEQVTPIATREVYTKPGTRTKLELSDGTLVWLNDGTTFRYPERFVGSKREVYLDGEAYFEVKSASDNSFIVNNPMMKTVVTGTHFNLNAYAEDNFFEATLLEGKVRLENKDCPSLTMIPGEQVQFDALNNKISRKNVKPDNAIAWINGQLIFENDRLETAIKKLGRWFNVKIILADPELKNYLLTGTIEDEKLIQTLNMITFALPMKYKFLEDDNPAKIQRTIYIMKK